MPIRADQELPDGLSLVRTTAEFTESTVPAGLLRAHKVAKDVWGRVVVLQGIVGFVFEDEAEITHSLAVGDSIVIPPQQPHHVVVHPECLFVVEFYRPSSKGL